MFKFLKQINSKRYDTLAGTLSFFFIMSCIPIAYVTLFFYNMIALRINLESSFLEDIKASLSFDLSVGVSIFFIITTIYSASKLFVQIKKTGEIIYNVKKPRSSIKIKMLSLLGAIIFVGILIAGLLFIAFANHIIKGFPPIVLQIVTILAVGTTYFFLVVLIDKLASPNTDMKAKVKAGALVTLIYTAIASALFYVYLILTPSSYDFLYGYLTTVLLFLLWVYLLMKGIVIGMVVNYNKYKN